MKKTLLTVAALSIAVASIAQGNTPSVINSSGGSAQAGYYNFEWSVGELALVNQMSNSSGDVLIISNGFIQPYILNPAANNQHHHFGNDEIKVFPIPASSYVEINFFTKQKGRISLSFYDAAGKKIFAKELQGNGVDIIERIPVSHLANAVYALHIDLNAEPGYVSKRGMYKIIKAN